ncbi:flavodoxin family protein, partial [Vibrio cholerae]|uniref:flavodoxin family protein n=5 Tax=Vibrionaceae TaxID=641 RepID=UPI0022F2DF85
EVFQASTDTTLFDLSDYAISFYDYEHMNRNDDFIHLINKLAEFDHLVFASPVYWYSMSAQLKVFFDRLSDLLTIEKELGRC